MVDGVDALTMVDGVDILVMLDGVHVLVMVDGVDVLVMVDGVDVTVLAAAVDVTPLPVECVMGVLFTVVVESVVSSSNHSPFRLRSSSSSLLNITVQYARIINIAEAVRHCRNGQLSHPKSYLAQFLHCMIQVL